MKDYNNADFRRELIMDHYSNPKFKKNFDKPDLSKYSNHCVDELHIQWNFEGEVLIDAKWKGVGCAVFQSSTDIFLEQIIKKTKKEIVEIANNYENLINQNETYNEEILGNLMIYINVKKQLNRLNCANMVSQAILNEINDA